MMNIRNYSKNSRTKSRVNLYSFFQREKENSEYKLMLQEIQLDEFHPRNKKGNGNTSHFYQRQYNQ